MTHPFQPRSARIRARLAGLGLMLVLGLPGMLRAQFVYQQDFKGTSAAGWVFGAGAGSPFTPVLTASAGIDAVGDGWLRMTDLQANEATYARLSTPIPSANNNITVSLDLAMWNQSGGAGAADGMTISLRDASVGFVPGAYGGSLGYANGHGIDGMAGGYFSLGIDNYGNYSNPTEGRTGGIGFVPNAIATRGPGNGQTGYAYLGGTTDLNAAPYSMGNLDFPGATARPDQTGVDFRQLVFNLDSSSILTVSMKFGTAGTLTQIYTADLSGFARPENLELVYTGSTGGGQQVNELRSLVVTTTAAPVGNVYYSNYANDNKWGTGANWGDSNVPNLGLVPGASANLIFSNNPFTTPSFQLTTAQNVDLQQNRQAASVQFDAPFNYTLQGHQLTLDNGGNSTAITVTSAQPGGAHTIQSNLLLNSNLNINTNTSTALVLSGNINAGTKTFTLNNLGTTTFAGQITGSGTMTQMSTGTIVVSGNSSSTYTGDIDIQKGTLQLGGSNVLNAATDLSLSSVTGTGTFNLAGNNQTLGSLTFASGGTVTTGSGVLTLGGNVTSASSATTALIQGNLDLGSANRTFSVAEGAAVSDMTIAANIASASGAVTKTGNGTLTVSGNNTYGGTTTISAGTLIAGHDNALGTAAGATTTTVAAAATLGLQGDINVSSLEAITLNGDGYAGRSGAIDNLSGANSIGGPVTLAANSTLGATAGTLTVAGAIGQSGGARTLTANGAGTIVLAGSNTYTGATTVNAGTTLVAASNNALGTNAANTTVANGATLGFQGGINYSTTETLSVRGTGVAGRNGAIDNLSGDNTFAGAVGMVAATTIGAASGSQLTLNGVVSGGQNLTIGGTGTVVLGGGSANTYTGTTTVNSGATLVAAKNSAMGTNAAGTTVNNGATLGFQGGITYSTTEALNVRGVGAAGRNGAIENLSGTNSYSGAVTLGGATTVAAATGSQLTLGGVVSGAQNLTKTGAGTLVLSAANTYSGTTTINAGTLALAGAGTITATTALTISDATFTFDNTGANSTNRVFNATTISLNDGTIRFLGNAGANSTETLGTVTANTGNSTFFLDAGNSFRADVTLGNLARNGSATITFATDGSVLLGAGATSAGVANSPRVFLTQVAGAGPGGSIGTPTALPGWILVSDLAGASNFAEYTGAAGTGNGVRAVQNYYTGALGINVNVATANVLLSSTSPLGAYTLTNNLGGTTTDGNLKITDAALVNLNTNAASTLRLNNGGLLKSGATATTISGAGRLTGGFNGTLAVTVDNAGGSLSITSAIIDRGVTSLTKSGPGLLELFGTNTFTGAVNINDGILRINGEAGLGGTAATKTITFSGGTLNVTAGFTANAAKTWTIASGNTGTFDIDSGQTLTIGAAGDLTSGSTASQLIKSGAGTLALSAANTGFTGTTLVNAGNLRLDNANSLGNTSTTITLAGGALDLRNNAATLFSNNLAVTGDATVSVDRVTTGSDLGHALGSLAIGSNTLTISGGNGYNLSFGATTLSGAATIDTATAGTDVKVDAVSGAGSLTKTGVAVLELAGVNTYAGATTVNGGTLRVSNATATLPTGTALTVAGGATFDLNGFSQSVGSVAGGGNVTMSAGLTTGSNDASTAFSGVISGTGGLTKTGGGTMTLSGANTFTGALALNQGNIDYAASGVLADSVAVTVAGATNFNLGGYSDTIGSLAGAGAVQLGSGTLTAGGNDSSTTFSGLLSGSGGNLVKTGTGTMTLTGGNSFTGTTGVSAGTLAINSSSALGTGDGSAGTGTTVANNATLQISGAINVANEALTLSGTGASGNGALQNISGNNTLGGPVALAADATVHVNAGNLSLGNTLSNAGNTLTVAGTGNTIANGAIVGSGGLVKNGAGALILNNTGNTYAGATTLNAGSIQIGANNAGPAASAFTLASGATLDVNNKSAAIASLAGSSGSSVVLGTGTLAAGGNNTSTSYAGVISGAGGGFTKDGSGTLTLSGANTYTGATTINTGTLAAGANNVLSNQTAVTVAGGASFTLNNTTQAVGSIAGAGGISLGSGQLVAGANNSSTTYSGVMTGSGSFTKDGSGTLTLTGGNTYSGATIVAGGNLTLGASDVLNNATNVTLSNGTTLALGSGVTEQIAGLATSPTSTINLSANAVLTSNTVANSTLFGSLTGTGTLAFNGGGNVTLGNDFNFGGGTLAFGGTTIGGTPTSTLFLGGNDLNLGTLHITGDTILDFGNSASSILTSANFTIDAGVKITINNWVRTQDFFFVNDTWTGAVLGTEGQGSQTQITFATFLPTETQWQSWDRQISPTPEPATYGLMLGGALGGLLGFRRWRKSRRA